MGADMGTSGVYLTDLLQVQKIFPGKFGRGVEYPVGGDVLTLVAGFFHVRFFLIDIWCPVTVQPSNVPQVAFEIFPICRRELWNLWDKYTGFLRGIQYSRIIPEKMPPAFFGLHRNQRTRFFHLLPALFAISKT